MEKTTKHALIAMCTLAAFQAGPSLAVDAYRQGSDSYRRGDYKTALAFLLKAAATYPSSPDVHYQLANTYMQLNRRIDAKREYASCLSLRPDVTTAEYCRRMTSLLSGGQNARPTGESEPLQIANSGGTAGESSQSRAAMELEQRRQEILMKAAAEVRKIKAEAEREIQEIEANTNQRVIDMETGEVSLGISGRQAREIRDEADQRAKQIMWQAEDRAKHLLRL